MPNRVYVDNPQPARWRYGLMSALTMVPSSDPHVLNGVDFRSDACGQASYWLDHCNVAPGPSTTCPVIVTAEVQDPCMCEIEVTVTLTDEGDGISRVMGEVTSEDSLCDGIEVQFSPVAVTGLPNLIGSATVNGGPVDLGTFDLSGTSGDHDVRISYIAIPNGIGVDNTTPTQYGPSFIIPVESNVGSRSSTSNMWCDTTTISEGNACVFNVTVFLDEPDGEGQSDIVFAVNPQGPHPQCPREIELTIDGNTYQLPAGPSGGVLGQADSTGTYPVTIHDPLTGFTQTFEIQRPVGAETFLGSVASFVTPNTLPIYASADIAEDAPEGCDNAIDINISIDGGPQTEITTGEDPVIVGGIGYGETVEVEAQDPTTLSTATGNLHFPEGGCSGDLEPNDCAIQFELQAESFAPILPDEKTFAEGLNYDNGEPFTLYSGVKCKLTDVNEMLDAIRRRFEYAEQRALEETFWVGPVGNYPALSTDPNVIVIPGLQVGIEAAVGALEQEIAEQYGGVGVIHASRSLMPYAAEANLIVRDGPLLTTPLGTVWAFGGGYDPEIGPVGQPPAGPGEAWMYATGQVVGRRGEVMVVPVDGNALDRTTNDITVLAERTWVLTRDCVTIAVLVEVADLPDLGSEGE